MADDYSPVPGKFKAMVWDGSNTEAFKAWVQTLTSAHSFGPADWSIGTNTDGTIPRLTLSQGSAFIGVDEGNYGLFGPYWGTDPTVYWPVDTSPWTQLPAAELGREFGASS